MIRVPHQVMSLYFSTLSSLHCMYDMNNTRPHPCMQPCKRSEWVNKYTFHMGHPSGFEDTVYISIPFLYISLPHILCLVYTVQPLDHYLCKHSQSVWALWEEGLWLERIFNCLCNTNTPYNSHACPRFTSLYCAIVTQSRWTNCWFQLSITLKHFIDFYKWIR